MLAAVTGLCSVNSAIFTIMALEFLKFIVGLCLMFSLHPCFLFAKLSFKCHECVFSYFHFFPGVVYNAEQIRGIERTVRRVPNTCILVRGGYKLENMTPNNIESSFCMYFGF